MTALLLWLAKSAPIYHWAFCLGVLRVVIVAVVVVLSVYFFVESTPWDKKDRE